MKKIEVILASYNGSMYIKEQIVSILMNFDLLDNYECKLLISDDASTDSTIDIVKNMQDKDSRIMLLDANRKGGVKKNFNTLIRNTSADYVFFSDQDDLWLPGKLSIFMEKFKKIENEFNGPVLIHSDLSVADKDLSPISVSMFDYQNLNKNPDLTQIMVSNSITGCVMACNKNLMDIVKKSNIDDSIMHDWYIGFCAAAFGVICFIDKPLILYRQHGNNQVGAKAFNIINLFNAGDIKDKVNKTRNSIYLTKLQTILFLNDFSDVLDYEKKDLLIKYVESFDKGVLARGRLFFFKKVRKTGFIRNVFYFLFYVLCKWN